MYGDTTVIRQAAALRDQADDIRLRADEPVGRVTVQFDAGGKELAGHQDHPRYVAAAAAAGNHRASLRGTIGPGPGA